MDSHEFELTTLQYARPRKGANMKLYLYDEDGFHSGAVWFTSGPILYPEEVQPAEVAIALALLHIKSKLEVRITDGGDMLLFHAVGGVVLYPADIFLDTFLESL